MPLGAAIAPPEPLAAFANQFLHIGPNALSNRIYDALWPGRLRISLEPNPICCIPRNKTMRCLPILILLGFLVRGNTSSGWTSNVVVNESSIASCDGVRQDIRNAVQDGDYNYLRGMTFPNGIAVCSLNGSVSQNSLLQAIDAWNDSLPTRPFRLCKKGENPDVTVAKVSKVEKADDLQGEIITEEEPDGSIKGFVRIGSDDSGRKLSDVAIGAVLTHELGHLLGLDDAPKTVKMGTCVMGEFDPEHIALRPTSAEVGAVEQLRSDVLRMLRDIRQF